MTAAQLLLDPDAQERADRDVRRVAAWNHLLRFERRAAQIANDHVAELLSVDPLADTGRVARLRAQASMANNLAVDIYQASPARADR